VCRRDGLYNGGTISGSSAAARWFMRPSYVGVAEISLFPGQSQMRSVNQEFLGVLEDSPFQDALDEQL
jgi:hypothetical protein